MAMSFTSQPALGSAGISAEASQHAVVAAGRDLASSGAYRPKQASRPHTWGEWVVVDVPGGEEELQERVCVGCGADELAATDCLGPQFVQLAASAACAGSSWTEAA